MNEFRQHNVRAARLTCVIRAFLLLAAAGCLHAQAPTIGEINVYGLRKTPADKLQGVLKLKPGDPLPPSKGDLEERLEEIPGVVLARVTALCCEDSRALLFVGIEEKGAAHFALRSEPTGSARLPDDILDTYRRFLEAVEAATRQGNTGDDLTHGHSLMADPAARALQLKFAEWTAANLPLARSVLRTSGDEEHRAIAAALVGYAPKKRLVIDDLQYAMQDPDEAVRANTMRSLAAIAVLAAREPGLELQISPTWFVEMLNSVALSDRLKAAEALVILSDPRPPALLALLRERGVPALSEMARWKSLRYALPAFVIAGRLAGLKEDEIHARWEKGDRESVLDELTGDRKKKSR